MGVKAKIVGMLGGRSVGTNENPARLVVPALVRTETLPDVPYGPTTAVIKESDVTVNEIAGTPPKETLVAPRKPLPIMATSVPLVATVGVNDVMRSVETPPGLGRIVSLAITGFVIVRGVLNSAGLVQAFSSAMQMQKQISIDEFFIGFT